MYLSHVVKSAGPAAATPPRGAPRGRRQWPQVFPSQRTAPSSRARPFPGNGSVRWSELPPCGMSLRFSPSSAGSFSSMRNPRQFRRGRKSRLRLPRTRNRVTRTLRWTCGRTPRAKTSLASGVILTRFCFRLGYDPHREDLHIPGFYVQVARSGILFGNEWLRGDPFSPSSDRATSFCG